MRHDHVARSESKPVRRRVRIKRTAAHTKVGLALFSSIALLALSACGSTVTSADTPKSGAAAVPKAFTTVLDQVKGLTGDARLAKLTDLAKTEGGTVSVYTSLNPANGGDELNAEFTKQTGIKVSQYRADDDVVRNRLTQEAAAHRVGADVDHGGGEDTFETAVGGLFLDYQYPELSTLIKGSTEPKAPGWIAYRMNIYSPAWNTKKVLPADVPTSLDELTDAKWKGKLAIESGDSDWLFCTTQSLLDQGKSQADVDTFFQKLAANAVFTDGHTATDKLLAAGQYWLMPDQFIKNAQNDIEAGDHVAYKPLVAPNCVSRNGSGVLKDAPHPAAALLFEEWMLSKGGAVMQEHDLLPTQQTLIQAAGVDPTKLLFIDFTKYVPAAKSWEDKLNKLAQLGGKA